MNNTIRMVNTVIYFCVSLTVLTIAGLLFKGLFVIYTYEQFASLATADILYALFWGVRFDLASAALFSLIISFVLWLSGRLANTGLLSLKQPAQPLLVSMLLIQMSLQIGDIMYFAESGRHVSYEMRDALTDASGLFLTAVAKHSVFIVLAYLLAFAFIFLYLKLSKDIVSRVTASARGFLFREELKLLLLLICSAVLIRGGVTGLPQSVTNAFNIGNAQQAIISMNGAYSVVYGILNSAKEISQQTVKLPQGIDVAQAIQKLYPAAGSAAHEHGQHTAHAKKYNLVFVLMEGWPADRVSGYGYHAKTTPFFDSLMAQALTPRGVISGGVRTTEGIFSIFCSQQNPLGETVAQTSLQNNAYSCLPEILKQYGWHTAFFQGTHKETSGTGSFAQALGFTHSYAKEDMPEPRYPHNYWGAHDPDVYDFVLSKLDEMPQPFLAAINTNSTHDLQLPQGVTAHFPGDSVALQYQSVLYFADHALSEFFAQLKQRPFYDNTVFVLVSDHTGGEHATLAERYYIPGIIYGEHLVTADRVNRYVSQRDFSPTVLELLGLPASASFAGKSFLPGRAASEQEIYFADYFDAGTIGWVSDDVLVETSMVNPELIKCFSLAGGVSGAAAVDCDERYKKASIQSLIFTSYSQDLLFKGKTKQFLDLMSE